MRDNFNDMKQAFGDTVKEAQDIAATSRDLILGTKQELLLELSNQKLKIQNLNKFESRVSDLQKWIHESFVNYDSRINALNNEFKLQTKTNASQLKQFESFIIAKQERATKERTMI